MSPPLLVGVTLVIVAALNSTILFSAPDPVGVTLVIVTLSLRHYFIFGTSSIRNCNSPGSSSTSGRQDPAPIMHRLLNENYSILFCSATKIFLRPSPICNWWCNSIICVANLLKNSCSNLNNSIQISIVQQSQRPHLKYCLQLGGSGTKKRTCSCHNFGSSRLMIFTRPLIDPQCNSSQDDINGPLLAVQL